MPRGCIATRTFQCSVSATTAVFYWQFLCRLQTVLALHNSSFGNLTPWLHHDQHWPGWRRLFKTVREGALILLITWLNEVQRKWRHSSVSIAFFKWRNLLWLPSLIFKGAVWGSFAYFGLHVSTAFVHDFPHSLAFPKSITRLDSLLRWTAFARTTDFRRHVVRIV
jgi:hypothetical protein